MNISPYEFSQFTRNAFTKYYSNANGWSDFSNDFIKGVFEVVPEFIAYQGRAVAEIDESPIYTSSSADATTEKEKAEALKKEWHTFVERFNSLEKTFEQKYQAVMDNFDAFMQNGENRKTFLAEYSAYNYLESMYQPLASFEEYLDNFRNDCISFKPQGQPS